MTGGSVTIDGQDLRDITQESLRAAIGMVPQDTVLFNDSIGYNIEYGRPGATPEEVRSAAAMAPASTRTNAESWVQARECLSGQTLTCIPPTGVSMGR